MPRLHKRITIAPGIVRDGTRLIVTKRAGARGTEKDRGASAVYPLGTELAVMQAWQLEQARDFLLASPRAVRGSLAADVPEFLALLPTKTAKEQRYKADSAAILQHWIDCELGARARASIVPKDLTNQIKEWTDAGAAANTCNRRLSRLRRLYAVLDPDAPNPAEKVTFLPEPKFAPRDIPTRIVKMILECLPDQGRAKRDEKRPEFSETKLRLAIMAWTGIMQAQWLKVEPRHLDLKGSRIFVMPRDKGEGAEGAWLALLPEAVEAIEAWVKAGLLGKAWSNSSVRKSWLTAIKTAKRRAAKIWEETGDDSWARELANLPPKCKPYDLRHSFATEVYAITGDIRAVAELLQHATFETTKRYTKGAVSGRVTAAIGKVAAAHATASAPPPPAAPAPAAPAPPAPAPKKARVLRLVSTR